MVSGWDAAYSPSTSIVLPSRFSRWITLVKPLLEGVVVADDDQLVEATHAADLLGEIASPLAVHILGRLVEEGDVEPSSGGAAAPGAPPAPRSSAHRRSVGRMCAPVRPYAGQSRSRWSRHELRRMVAHDLAEDAVGLSRDRSQQRLHDVGAGLFIVSRNCCSMLSRSSRLRALRARPASRGCMALHPGDLDSELLARSSF